MVIHDLKHPTESMISQLQTLQFAIFDQITKIEHMTQI